MKSILCRLIVLAVLTFSTNALAHERSESYSHWYADESSLTGTVTIPLREVMLLYQAGSSEIPPRDLFRNHLAESTTVTSGGAPCEQVNSEILQAASGFVRVEISFVCDSGIPASMRYRGLFDVAPGHVHYAKLHRPGAATEDRLLTDNDDTWTLDLKPTTATANPFPAYFKIGIEHISTGSDHIAFLLGLLLIAGTVGRSVVAVTGFTLGHSLSLGAAVLGYVSAEARLVEAFIGFTVALVAVEYFLLRNQSVRVTALLSLAFAVVIGLLGSWSGTISAQELAAYLGFGIFAACYLLAARIAQHNAGSRATLLLFAATMAFGLVHGFGFAGFLMETGITGGSLFLPLLGFNLGVEMGQLLIIAALLMLGRLLGQRLPRIAPQLLAAGLCGIGVFWFVGRSLA